MHARTLAAMALIFTATPATAQLALRQSEVVNGAYSTIGNLLIDCPSASTCDNNTSVMTAVDVDTDAATSMSSSATLDIPAAAVVRTAYLYISASGTETTQGTNPGAWVPADIAAYGAWFATPAGGYNMLIPDDVQPNITQNAYLARFDVTSLVTGSGEYFVANALLPPASHGFNRILSWVLFVSFDDGSPARLVNVYDGTLECFQNTTMINLAGFRTPAAGTTSALFTAFSVDGHPTISGETITVGALQVSNPTNPSNNIGNATVSSPTGPIPRNPMTFRVTEEMDLDTFDVSTAFTNSQTNVDIRFVCGTQEGVVYQMAVIAMQIVAPQLVAEKSVVDLNGGDVIAGDELEYRLSVQTSGGDDAVDVVLRDVLPEGLNYVAGSILYGATATIAKTDAAGDDEAEFTGTELIFRLGPGASATRGGTIAVGLEEVVQFHAIVESATVARAIINQAIVTARGAQGGSGSTSIEVLSSAAAVDTLPCIGFENGSCPDAGVLADAAEPDAALDDASEDAGGDTGTTEADAGVLADATVQSDASVSAPDATVLADSGNNGGSTGNEDEGCDCSSARAQERSAGGPVLAMLAIAWIIVRRRRHVRRAQVSE